MSNTAETPPPEEPHVEIHKPKPIHSWRELLTEIGVVVIGVCIALGAEQTVEWFHWRDQVAQARAAIASEATENIWGAIRRIRTVQCTDQRLEALGRILDDAARSGQLPAIGYIGQPPRHWARTGVWESIVASQTATHFSRQELWELASIYKFVDRFGIYLDIENEAWSSLYAMVGPGRRLDPASEAELRKALGSARNANRTLAQLSNNVLTRTKRLDLPFNRQDQERIAESQNEPLTGVKASLLDASPLALICDPIGPVPPNYGEAQVRASTALIENAAKQLTDFSFKDPLK